VAERIRDLVPRDIPIPRVAVLGLSFKANTSDRRESPAVSIIRRLREAGCHVSAFDPTSSTDDKDLISSGVVIAPSWTEAVRDVDVIAVLTEWRDFGTLDWSVAVPLVRHAVIYDARGIVDQARAQSAGFTINGVTSHSGRSS
jgi:UDPglucose 6-dehydrogenase